MCLFGCGYCGGFGVEVFCGFSLICVLRVCGVLLFAPWFYAGCTVGGSAKTMVRLRAIVLAAFVAIVLLFWCDLCFTVFVCGLYSSLVWSTVDVLLVPCVML